MADGIRQRIINALDTRLKTITTPNGYETNIGDKVFHWRGLDFPQSDMPLIEYSDPACKDVPGGPNGFHTFLMGIEIKVITASGSTTLEQVRKMLADVHKALGQDLQWGGLAIDTLTPSDRIEIDHKDKKLGGALITFDIKFRTRAFNPYSQA